MTSQTLTGLVDRLARLVDRPTAGRLLAVDLQDRDEKTIVDLLHRHDPLLRTVISRAFLVGGAGPGRKCDGHGDG